MGEKFQSLSGNAEQNVKNIDLILNFFSPLVEEAFMKKIILIIFIFFALSAMARSTEFYHCVDKDGNVFITDNPPQDAQCKINETEDDSAEQPPSRSESPQSQQDDDKKDEAKKLLKIKRPGMI